MPTGNTGEPHAAESSDGLADRLTEARPTVDYAAMEDVRAKAEQALFGRAEPPRLGRFVLLQPLAGGGMGMIHRAYDPQLERPVALKLLHPRHGDSGHGRAQLVSEARVLAKLSHPNVVPVYDVVEIEGQVVVVMELVDGRTLAELERGDQSWREIVSVYVQAGHGLAAAHELGIVHRDFKPANAVVGDDGRVRVLDFGLALSTDDAKPNHHVAARPTGAPPVEILGTLHYMAPEQLAGQPVTVASDQFSFCVALFRALYHEPPFAGNDVADLRAAITSGRIRASSRAESRVPGWLRLLLVRGLAAAPEARHPSMRVLLDELARDRGWRRWRGFVFAAVTAVLALVALIVGTARTSDPLASCDGGLAEVARVWNPARSASVGSALGGVATSYARAISGRVLADLDGYRARWSAVHRTSCRDYRMTRISAERFDRRMRCLGSRLRDLDSAIRVLSEVDASSITKAVDVAVQMPAVERCVGLDSVPGDDAAATPALDGEVAAIRAQLSLAGALERAGRSAEGLAAASQAVETSRRLAYAPILLEATLERGRLLLATYDFTEAVAALAVAEQLALARQQWSAAVIAGARRIYAEGVLGSDFARLSGQVELLEPMSRGELADRQARPLLLNYLGVVDMARGQRAEARTHFEAARDALVGVEAPDLELNAIDMNLAMVAEDRSMREAVGRRALQRFKDQLGPNHLTTLSEQCRYAHYLGDPVQALRLVQDADRLYREFHPERFREWSNCASYDAFLTLDVGAAGDSGIAQALYAEVAALANGTTDRDVLSLSRLANGNLHLIRAQPKVALASFGAVIDELGPSKNWWDQALVAEAQLGAGLAEDALAQRAPDAHLARAVAQLDRAAAGFATVALRNEDLAPKQRLALARFHLARILRRQVGAAAEDRVRQLEEQAAAFYREANPVAFAARLALLAH